MSSNTHLVFVYGSLMQGSYNNVHLRTATRLGEAVTAERYLLLKGWAYPFLINPAKLRTMTDLDGKIGRVKGEAYLVDDATLARLDKLESHPDFYKREQVAVRLFARNWSEFVDVKAWVYFLNETPDDIADSFICLPDADGICQWTISEEATDGEV